MRLSFQLSPARRALSGALYGAVVGVLFWLLWRRQLPAAGEWPVFGYLPKALAVWLRYLLPSAVGGAAAGAMYGLLLPRVFRLPEAIALTSGTLMLFTALVQVLAQGFVPDGLFVLSILVAMAIGLPAGVLARDGVVHLAPDLEPLERRTGSLGWSLMEGLQRLPLVGGRLRRLSRERLARQTFPADWLSVLLRHVPVYGRLPRADQEALQRRVLLFLAEKRIEGRGLVVTDAVRVTIAAQACLLTLRLEGVDGYARLRTIQVYPKHLARRPRLLEKVFAQQAPSSEGRVLLSWLDVSEGAANPDDGDNVVLHEFAHLLDRASGALDGEPALEAPLSHAGWVRVLHEEYERLCRQLQAGQPTVLGRGAGSAAEFFAVATEAFFERPRDLRAEGPHLYNLLRLFYRQDPARYGPADAPRLAQGPETGTDVPGPAPGAGAGDAPPAPGGSGAA